MSFVNGIKRSIKGVCIKIFGVWFANYTKFKITSLIIQVFGFKPLFKVLFIFIFIPIRIKLYLTRGWSYESNKRIGMAATQQDGQGYPNN